MGKIRNLNVREELIKRLCALALAGTMTFTMCGCGGKAPKLTVKIPTSSTIGGTLDSIRDLTTMDELLMEDKFVNKSDGQEYTFDELLQLYQVARQEENLSDCNTLLYKIGRMIMKAQIAEALNIEPEQITSLSIDGTIVEGHRRITTVTYKNKYVETVSGGIEINKEEEITRGFATYGEIDDLAINIVRASNHSLKFNNEKSHMDLDVDNVYTSFIEHLLTTPTISKTKVIFGDDQYNLDATLSQEKVDAFNDYVNGARNRSR